MKIAIGSDHGGYELKEGIIGYLQSREISYNDFGCYSQEAVDYTLLANSVAKAVAAGDFDLGILVCGTGIGMSIAANKVKGIRAAVCQNSYCAVKARLHNDANILCLGGRVIGAGVALDIVDLFIDTPFEGGRHVRRLNFIREIEEGAL